NPYDRIEDGRPKVPDNLLVKAKELTAEEVFAVLPKANFPNQFEGNWKVLHPGKKLVGRAVTAQFMPPRPDVADVSEGEAKMKGFAANANKRVLDMLEAGDGLVVDLFGKIEKGTVVR